MAAPENPAAFHIGWIAALAIERAAATAMLDDRYQQPTAFEQHKNDTNSYTWGRMGKHYIVIASLAAGVHGTTSAATTASNLLASLPHIRIGLLVGIGGGIARPDIDQDVRLGDVVVSRPQGRTGGVIQYDFRKAKMDQNWEQRGSLSKPPYVLLNALGALEAEHEISPSKMSDFLNAMWEAHPQMKKSKKKDPAYVHQGFENDTLFPTGYDHAGGLRCIDCDPSQAIEREERDSAEPQIHYGVIASGNTLVADATTRDNIAAAAGSECLCIEMEAAGLMDHFPCLVIRGICDYADSHKNDTWQRYASATAAAYAKELLSFVPLKTLEDAPLAADILKSIEKKVEGVKLTALNTLNNSLEIKKDTIKIPDIKAKVESLQATEKREEAQRITDWLAPILFARVQKETQDIAQKGTGEWFLNCDHFRNWVASPGATLWCPGIGGAGKTVMTSIIVAHLLKYAETRTDTKVACAYCDYKKEETHDPMGIVMGLWRQLLDFDLPHTNDVQQLWNEYRNPSMIRSAEKKSVNKIDVIKAEIDKTAQTFLIVDALDELPEDARPKLLDILRKLQQSGKCNVLVTSRPYESIAKLFDGDGRIGISAQMDDLLVYITARTQDDPFPMLRSRIPKLEETIVEIVIPKCRKMFLLAKLYMDELAEASRVRDFNRTLQNLPEGLDDTYKAAITRIEKDRKNRDSAMQALFWVTFATRPLSVGELIQALAVEPGDRGYDKDNELLVDITSICAALILVDSISNTVRLAHYTAEQYLRGSYETWFPQIFEHMATRLLIYLSFDTFKTRLSEEAMGEDVRKEYPLLEYAALNWGTHFKRAPDLNQDMRRQALNYLQQDFRLSDLIVKNYIEDLFDRDRFVSSVAGNVTSLHLAVLFDLEDMVPLLQAHETENPNEEPLVISPLNLASRMERVQVARALLDGGADANGIPGFAWRPIHHAARWNTGTKMITLLLDHGADINAKVTVDAGDTTSYCYVAGQSPLSEAAQFKNTETAKALLQRGSEVFEQGQDYEDTPFAWCQNNDVFPLLLDTIQGPLLPLQGLMLPIIQFRSLELLESLIRRGLDVNQLCKGGNTALDYALRVGDGEMISLLLKNGARPGHKWTSEDEVSRFSSAYWFADLNNALSTCISDVQGHGGSASCSDAKTWDPCLELSMYDPVVAQIQVTVGEDIEVPIQRLVFRTESHDQGWSGNRPHHGTYRSSCTGFNVRVRNPVECGTQMVERSHYADELLGQLRLHASKPGVEAIESGSEYSEEILVQWNVHASSTWRTHLNTWDREDASPDMLRIMNRIGKGSTVELIARALYPGWVNFVRYMGVEVHGRDATKLASS